MASAGSELSLSVVAAAAAAGSDRPADRAAERTRAVGTTSLKLVKFKGDFSTILEKVQ